MIPRIPRKKGTPLIAISLAAVVGIAVWLGNGNRDRNAPGDPPRVSRSPGAGDKGVASFMTPEEQLAITNARPCDHTVLTDLDLSRPPSEAELIAAGNLGEPLTPTSPAEPSVITDPGKRRLQEAQNLAFGTAIQAWNAHSYEEAVELFESYLKEFPGSPWAAECELHLGCYCQYKGRYLEAAGRFETILEEVPATTRMYHKAKLRRSILHVDQGQFDEAEKALGEMYRDDPDADHKTYASYWLREIGLLRDQETALRDCGQRALARACEIRGNDAAAELLRAMPAAGPHGFTARELFNTALLQGLDPRPVMASGALDDLPVPFVAHYNDRHFVTVEDVADGEVRLFDTRVGTTHVIPIGSFRLQWSGFAMLFENPPAIAAIAPAENLEALVGGCCGFPRLPSDLGDDPCAEKNCGMPGWSVNVVNMNFRVQDTPMWWNPPFGPPVEISLLFNSLDSLNNLEPFGPKWAFTYASYALIDPSESVTIRDGDGRFMVFTHPGGSGYPLTYTSPPGDERKLIQTDSHEFNLIQSDGTVYNYGIAGLMEGSSYVPLLLSITDRHGNALTIEHNSNGAITALKHSALGPNDQWTFHYKPGITPSRVERIVDPFGRECRFTYDTGDRLKTQTDMGGLEYEYTYTVKDSETTDAETNDDPFELVLPVTSELFITGIKTPKGWTTVYTEPADGDPDEFNTVYPDSGEPMGRNYRITITDPEDFAQEYYFDGLARGTWHRDAEQLAAAVPDASESRGWSGPYTRYVQRLVAGWGKVSSVTKKSDNGDLDLYSAAYFNEASRQAAEYTDATGETTWRGYFSNGAAKGKLNYVRLPKSGGAPDTDYEIRFEYDTSNGQDLVSVKRDFGGVEKTLLGITYYANRDPWVVTDVLGRSLTYTWNSNGLPSTVTWSETSDVITFQYDTNGRPSGILVNGQSVLTTGYDLEGRLLSVLDATGYLVSYEYDDLDRLCREDHPDGSFVERIWECCFMSEVRSGKTVSGADRVMDRTLISHDGRGLETRVTDTAGRVTRFGYDGAGRLETLTDPKGQTTTWEYDEHGRQIRKIYPDLSEEETGWLNAVQVDYTTNRRLDSVYFFYDQHGQVGEIIADEFSAIYNYDSWDRIESIDHDPTGGTVETHEFTHDLLGRVTSIDGPWTDDTISWAHNDALRKVTRTTPGNITTETVGDAYGRVASFLDPLGLFTFSYTGQSSKADSITHTQGNANEIPYAGFDSMFSWHDDSQRLALESVTHKLPGGSTIARHTYGYDSMGRIDSWKREAQLANPSGPTREFEWSVHHDLGSQLSSVVERSLSGTLQAGWHYGYDPAGNVTTSQSSSDTSSAASITLRAHNNLNQITSFGGGGAALVRGVLDEEGTVSVGLSGSGSKPARMLDGDRFEAELDLQTGTNNLVVEAMDASGNKTTETYQVNVAQQSQATFEYDDDGNLETDGVRSYEWDSLSRLTRVTWATGKTTEFKYNGLGQRAERIDTDGSTVTRHYYLYDGISLVDRRTGSSASTATVDRRYFAQGEQRVSGSTWQNYHYARDHLGSVREVVKWDGTLVARYDFDPYGRRRTEYEAASYGGACDLGFTGHITVPSLVASQQELVMAPSRAYDAGLGSWLSPDPLGEVFGINLYQYCLNAPLNFYDPNGLWPSASWWGSFFDHLFSEEGAKGLNEGAAIGADTVVNAVADIGNLVSPGQPLDGIKDPFANAGAYDPCDSSSKISKGFWTTATIAAPVGGGARGVSWLGKVGGGTKWGHWINHNRWLRFGPGRMPTNGRLPAGPKVPRCSIGPQRAGLKNPHFDLRIRPFD